MNNCTCGTGDDVCEACAAVPPAKRSKRDTDGCACIRTIPNEKPLKEQDAQKLLRRTNRVIDYR